MTDHEVEQALGYTPCICGVIDGAWHAKCYKGKSRIGYDAGYKKAFAKARAHLKAKAEETAAAAISLANSGQQGEKP